MRLRRTHADEPSLAADLTHRLAAYTVTEGVHCRGCGRWVAEDDAGVDHWSYYTRGDPTRLYPVCEDCARLGIARR